MYTCVSQTMCSYNTLRLRTYQTNNKDNTNQHISYVVPFLIDFRCPDEGLESFRSECRILRKRSPLELSFDVLNPPSTSPCEEATCVFLVDVLIWFIGYMSCLTLLYKFTSFPVISKLLYRAHVIPTRDDRPGHFFSSRRAWRDTVDFMMHG